MKNDNIVFFSYLVKFIGEPGQTIRLRRRELLLLIILIIAAGVLLGTGRKCFESVNIGP